MRYLFRVRRDPDGQTIAYVFSCDAEHVVRAQADVFLSECKPGGLVRVYRDGEGFPMLVRARRRG